MSGKSRNKKSLMVKANGTPSMMFLPARNYVFKYDEKKHSIKIPRRGKYVDLDGEAYMESDGEFNILEESASLGGQVIYMPSITKVLFAEKKYPDLKDTQAFVPMFIIVKEEEIEIVGNIIEMLEGE